MKKDNSVLLNQLDGNLASEVLTRCSGRPHAGRTGAYGQNVGCYVPIKLIRLSGEQSNLSS